MMFQKITRRFLFFTFIAAFVILFLQFLNLHSPVNIKHMYGYTKYSNQEFLLSRESYETTASRRSSVDHTNQFHTEKFHFEFPALTSVVPINCPLLFAGNSSEQKRAVMYTKESIRQTMEFYHTRVQNCSTLKQGYITSYLTQEEKSFPIAYSILVYKNLVQVERLLRAIYRPQNFYCIHIDLKADQDFKKTMSQIAACFDNVFITSRSVDVRWGTFTVLEPELICMKELWTYKTWKYFINLTGQEFPLRTNAEIVKILKIYNGTNDVGGTVKRANKKRWANAGSPPSGVVVGKGSVHITVNRHFVDYVLHNQTAQDFLNWCKKTLVPDETYFASLNHNPQLGILGSANGYEEPYIMNSRFKNWRSSPCAGKIVRQICIFGIGDLPVLFSRNELFANKFYWDFQPLTLDCMEELIYNRTRDGYLNKTEFNVTFYKNLHFLTNRSR